MGPCGRRRWRSARALGIALALANRRTEGSESNAVAVSAIERNIDRDIGG
jgi:hypothetical protein